MSMRGKRACCLTVVPPEVTAASTGTTAAASVESPRRLAAASANATRIFPAKSAIAAPKVVSAAPTTCIFIAKSFMVVTPKVAIVGVSSPTATETLIPTHINTNRARIITTSTRYPMVSFGICGIHGIYISDATDCFASSREL